MSSEIWQQKRKYILFLFQGRPVKTEKGFTCKEKNWLPMGAYLEDLTITLGYFFFLFSIKIYFAGSH